MILPVVGMTYNGRQAVIANLKPDEQLILRREPTNPYDRNAIAVDRKTGEQIGCIDRNIAAVLAPTFEKLNSPLPATVYRLSGVGTASSLGVEIKFSLT